MIKLRTALISSAMLACFALLTPAAELFAQMPAPTPTQSQYLDLAAHYAPIWYQAVAPYDSRSDQSDYISAVNYDGEWNTLNNWENVHLFPLKAYVYYSVVETVTHWFILYGIYFPRDWDITLGTFCPLGDQGVCHENDFEGAQVVVKKSAAPYGELLLVETEAHDILYVYPRASGLTSRIKALNQTVPVDNDHPKLFVESEGHGVYVNSSITGGDGFSNGNFSDNGVVYRYAGTAAQPAHANDRSVGYALLPVSTELWTRRTPESQVFLPNFQYVGARKALAEYIGDTFHGDNFADNRAHAPWAWDDASDGNVNKGDWVMDPAHSISQHINVNQTWSLNYLSNFYLSQIGGALNITQNNAAFFFSHTLRGAVGSKTNCQDNGKNRWCKEGDTGLEHWVQNLIGCYEIADDDCAIGNCDCRFDADNSHMNFADYAWNKTDLPFKLEQIDNIVVRTLTSPGVCAGLSGYEGDDGWGYNSGGEYRLSMMLSPENGWGARYCLAGGSGGPYELSAVFDAASRLDSLNVRAGDHHDEGAFQITGVDVTFKPMCPDGTVVEQCNAAQRYCSTILSLESNCLKCGYVCPQGTLCSSTGACLPRTPPVKNPSQQSAL